ncbi:primosomal protein N' [Methylomonas methanica]|uniref:Replication restart protein PriA n=1 Tax=Methylomonas methanica (strain DSM 25384 / MC09) TaxID=857087 RepID=G0A1E5_METMM|nr:primosomal protein N' [Methylomonas methanica]AEF98838.1 primosomal protein N' [Methylomonas methanica MC09]
MANCNVSRSLIVQIAIPVPLQRLFDYLPPEQTDPQSIQPGMRVSVPFGKGLKTGVVLQLTSLSDSQIDPKKLRRIEQVVDSEALLSPKDLQLLKWASRYYHHPLGEVMATAFPAALRQGKPAILQRDYCYSLTEQGRQTIPMDLKRASKQQALLTLFQDKPFAIAATELTQHKTALKALQDKGLIHKTLGEDSKLAWKEQSAGLTPNPEQQHAIDSVVSGLGQFSVSLLQGVTGSGKTEVYMQIIAEALSRGLQILVLLPEITLTPQLEQRFRQRFAAPIVCFHSKFNDSQRLHAWLNMQQGHAAIMLGTRSALFTPLKNPGLIILDEEHDSSFKQQEGFRFSARDVAIARAKILNVPVLLGSATPSFESLFNVTRQRYQLLQLSIRAGNAADPVFQLLDIRNKPMQAGLSEALITAIRSTLDKGQQVLLFLNRRGFAPVQICHGCGWVSRCGRCDANMVIHAAERRLRCHHCGSEQPLPKECPACKTGELQPLGLGTERIEQTLAELFPNNAIIRLDKDTTQRKGSLEGYLEQIHSGQADIILGTQMLAKGHHFPDVTLVAILDIDSGLFSVDFHAGEKLAQMIVQVAGRAGRADKRGRVVLQTRQPQHPLLTTLIEKGYQAFAEIALQERRQAGLPPFGYQALLRVQGNNAESPQQFLQAAVSVLHALNAGKTQILGPVTAPMARRAGQFRFQLLLQSPQRKDLHQLLDQAMPKISKLRQAGKVRWSLDVDPVDLY